MNDKALMRLFIECPETVRNLILTDSQIAFVEHIRDCGYPNVSAAELAERSGKSVQNISTQLSKLWRRGWLTRKQYTDETGGIYYRYSVAF